MKPKLKNSIGLVLVFSILVKGIGAVIEIIIQWLITQKIGISGYGDYTFYINCADISFWCLFSGIVKCNTFYLSDRNQSISLFKRKYFLYFMLPIILIALIAVTFFKQPVLYAVIVIVVLQFAVNDRSSTYMARGEYGIALSGEYVLGRAFLLVGYIVLNAVSSITIPRLLILYGMQYALAIYFFFCFQKKIRCENAAEVSVPIRKLVNYQQSDVVCGLIGQAPVILQYVFVGAFETGFMGIVTLVKRLVNFISGPTAKVFLPEFSKLYKNGDIDGLKHNYQLIMRIQMMFINILGVVLIGNTRWILSIFSPELLQYCTLFRIISVVFLFAATLGPSTGLMQMTGNESKDNSIRWISVFVMVLLWIMLRKNPMFALIGMTVQVGLESVLKFGYVCCWFKKSPIHPIRYLVMWIPVAMSSLIAHAISEKSMILSLLLSVFIVLIISFAVEVSDKNMRKKLFAILKRGE